MAPIWLTAVAWAYLLICFGCAGAIAFDIVFNHRRQPMNEFRFPDHCAISRTGRARVLLAVGTVGRAAEAMVGHDGH